MADEARRATIDTCLAEFNALRKEIADRSATQHTLVNLNLTAVAAVISLVATGRTSETLLLLFTAICSALAMLWADHARTIRNIGRYINNDIRQVLRRVADDEAILSWEERMGHYSKGQNTLISFRLPLILVFIGPPVAALLITSLHEPGFSQFDVPLLVYWVGGLIATIYMAAVFLSIQFSAHQEAPERGRSPIRRAKNDTPAANEQDPE